MRHFFIYLLAIAAITLAACGDDDVEPSVQVPDTYAFERDGSSSVSYQGQTDRLNQLGEIKSILLASADAGNPVTKQQLMAAYENEDGNGGGTFSFNSTKQLRNKTFQPDLDSRIWENIFEEIETASAEGGSAANGQAGLIVRENSGKTILLDSRGREFTQLVEKGLMGAVFYHQIFNVYLTDSRIGNAVENTALEDGENFTSMEHHWDEAFGYWSPPLDFTSPWPADRKGELRFWSNYSNTVDNVGNGLLGTNESIMNAFKAGRTAIVNKDYNERDKQRDILYDQLDLVAAATAVHYINSTLDHLNDAKPGEAFHTLAEAWAFTNALRYNPLRRLSLQEIETIMESDFGADGNFWNVTADGLNKAKSTLVAAYPEMEPVKDNL